METGLNVIKSQAERVAYIIDDDPLVVRTIQAGLKVIQVKTVSFDSAEAFLNVIDRDPHGCLLVDLKLKATGSSGLDLLRTIRMRGWTVPALVVSGTVTVPEAVDAIEYGVLDVLEKPMSMHRLQSAVDAALSLQRRNSQVNPPVLRKRVQELTEIESHVLRLMLEGRLNKSIASRLDIGLRSVVRHRKSIHEKLGFDTVPQLVRALTLAGMHDVPIAHQRGYSPVAKQFRQALQAKLNSAVDDLHAIIDSIDSMSPDLLKESLAQVTGSLASMSEDACFEAPKRLAEESQCLPSAVLCFANRQEGALFAGLMKLNELFPLLCHHPTDAMSSLTSMQDVPPAFVLLDLLERQPGTEELLELLSQEPYRSRTCVITIADISVSQIPPELHQVADIHFQRPVDSLELSNVLLDHLRTGRKGPA